MRISHLLLREHVARAFVFPDLVDVGIDAELVERAAEEHHIGSRPLMNNSPGGGTMILSHAVAM